MTWRKRSNTPVSTFQLQHNMTAEPWLRNEPTSGMSHKDAEICLNCWYFGDDTGVVLRIAAKAYALSGNDDEKLAVLKALSTTDHLTATHAKVPDRYSLSMDGQIFRGAVPTVTMQENAIHYFDDLIEELTQNFPRNIHAIHHQPRAFQMKLTEPFLWICTYVHEAQDGSLIARVSH
jgi:hypothetical protein